MEKTLRDIVTKALGETYGITDATYTMEHPKDLLHGDYATNAALIVGKKIGKEPTSIAEELVATIEQFADPIISSVSVAGPGFINIMLERSVYTREVTEALSPTYANNTLSAGRRIMVEYTDPNPFKPFHIGHLMTNAIGESIARLLDASGASVIRANYQGDIGRHVAMAIYGLQEQGMPDASLSVAQQAQYIGTCYVYGNSAYESTTEAKEAIDGINKKLYEKSDKELNAIYEWGKKVTLEAFEEIYKVLGTTFDYYFFESDMADKGTALVKEYLGKGIFKESDGAVVFAAELFNPKLHTRVFITRLGLPTYETKELGLTMTKFEHERLDQSIVITADEQKDYMAVATEAIRQMRPEYAAKMHHITHGMMRFASGKMSSRKGNVITGESLLEDARMLVREKMKDRDLTNDEQDSIATKVAVSAVKYAILRQSVGGNIIYDEAKSISFEGDSGPYLQYTATRAKSVLAKAASMSLTPSVANPPDAPYDIERVLYRFPTVVMRATNELEPHHLVTFLTDLASRFNHFYATEAIASMTDEYASYKLALTQAVHTTLVRGLWLLGIDVPEKM